MIVSTSPSIRSQFKQGQFRHGQRGAALIVGLIMLLLLTLIGVAGMRDTLLQEKMAANMRDREVALQAAESALRAAEVSLSGTEPIFTNSNGLYNLETTAGLNATKRLKSGNPISEVNFWKEVWTWANADSIVYPYALTNVVARPRYLIEKLQVGLTDLSKYGAGGYASGSGLVSSVDTAEVPDALVKPDYRVTVRAQGVTTDSTVILQSTFRRQ